MGDTALENRDYTIILDQSGSMGTKDMEGRTRWRSAEESVIAIASKCEQYDADGLTLYLFNRRFKRFENVTSERVASIFKENDPQGGTDIAAPLKDAVDNYFSRKKAGKAKANGEIMLVITDGVPDTPTGQADVIRVLREAANGIELDSELGISFIQIGKDEDAKKFLQICDDDMKKVGAKFDIVDTITYDQLQETSITDILMRAIDD